MRAGGGSGVDPTAGLGCRQPRGLQECRGPPPRPDPAPSGGLPLLWPLLGPRRPLAVRPGPAVALEDWQ